MDQISTLRQILEKTREYSIETHHIFVDFKGAYDTVKRTKLYEAMHELDVPPYLIKLTKLTIKEVKCKVCIQGNLSQPFETKNGLRQDDALSCILFNLALKKVIRSSQITTTGTIFNKSVQILAIVDNVDIISRTEAMAKETFIALEAANKMGIVVNTNKTKYMPALRPAKQHELQIGQKQIEMVDEFIYLVSMVNTGNNITAEIKRRILLANRCYFELITQLRS